MIGLDKTAAAAGSFARALPVSAAPGQTTPGQTGAGVASPFSGVFHALVDQTQSLSKQATDAASGLLNGQGVEIHDVMIAQQKASVAFELALQVRNKAVAAYQQLMGMQF